MERARRDWRARCQGAPVTNSDRRSGLGHRLVIFPDLGDDAGLDLGFGGDLVPEFAGGGLDRVPLAAGMVVSFILSPVTRNLASPDQYQCWR